MTGEGDAPILLCEDGDGFLTAAERWAPGRPFPVLAGPALERYRRLFADRPLPAVSTAPRRGVVLSTGNGVCRAAGALLAAATGRPHRHLPLDLVHDELVDNAGQLVALVGVAHDLCALGDWPGTSGALVGLVTARSEEALSCLVYRSLTAEAAHEERVFISSHPMFRTAVEADAVDLPGLRRVLTRRPKVLVLRGQGRECSFGLLDGSVCGRDEHPAKTDRPLPPIQVAPGQRATPCLRGDGCFRTDLGPEGHVQAHELNAVLVFAHSCSAVGVGVGAYPPEINLGLGLMDSTAVAVIGVLGVHVAQRGAQRDLEAALARGLPLGEIVPWLEGHARPLSGDLVRFGLLGDPGLVLDWRDPAAVTAGPDGRARQRHPFDQAAVDLLGHAHQVVIPRLERLRWLDLDVEEGTLNELRSRIRLAVRDPYEPGIGAEAAKIADDLAELQTRSVERLAHQIYVEGWIYGGPAFAGMRQTGRRAETCPNCRRARAVHLTLRHTVDPELTFQTLQCRRCGDVWWTSESGEPTLALDGPLDLAESLDRPFTLERLVVNRADRPVSGAVGYAFRQRKIHGLPPGRVERCTVPPHGTHRFRAEVDLAGARPRADAHTTPFVALLDGVYVASMVMLTLA
jgi:hypothetical protein